MSGRVLLSHHYAEVCEFGVTHGQCRCPGPKKEHKIKCDMPDEHRKESKMPERMAGAYIKITFQIPWADLDPELRDEDHIAGLSDEGMKMFAQAYGADYDAALVVPNDDV